MIYIFHASDKMMIHQGTDGIFRGIMGEGVDSWKYIMSPIPFNETPGEKYSKLVAWIKSWAGIDTELLTGESWFERVHS